MNCWHQPQYHITITSIHVSSSWQQLALIIHQYYLVSSLAPIKSFLYKRNKMKLSSLGGRDSLLYHMLQYGDSANDSEKNLNLITEQNYNTLPHCSRLMNFQKIKQEGKGDKNEILWRRKWSTCPDTTPSINSDDPNTQIAESSSDHMKERWNKIPKPPKSRRVDR